MANHDPIVHELCTAAAGRVRQMFNHLLPYSCDPEDVTFYGHCVRAEILAMADRGELSAVGVTSSQQIAELRVSAVGALDKIDLNLWWQGTCLAERMHGPENEAVSVGN